MKAPAFFLLALTFLFAACNTKKKEQALPPAYDTSVQTDLVDVAYGSDPRHRYNLYLPANRGNHTPVLFIIHGGAWVGGSKEAFVSAIPGLRQLFPTYAFVLVNYRLYSSATPTLNRFPSQELDIQAAVAHVLSRSATYGTSVRFALWGQSAGAHLAALYAYKYANTPYKASACIDQAGPTDMLSLYGQLTDPGLKGLLEALVGDPRTGDSLLYKSSSPVNYVNAGSCPTLILHGDADEVVPYPQAEQLQQVLNHHGVEHTYKLYPGQGHTLQDVGPEVLGEAVAFLNKHLK